MATPEADLVGALLAAVAEPEPVLDAVEVADEVVMAAEEELAEADDSAAVALRVPHLAASVQACWPSRSLG